MGLMDLIKPVPSIKADDVRALIDKEGLENINLIDVRLPIEYEDEHIPGAALLPIDDLQKNVDSIDPSKKTIAY